MTNINELIFRVNNDLSNNLDVDKNDIKKLLNIAMEMEKQLAISRVVSMYSCDNCGSEDIDKEESFCNNCSEYLDY